jgi:hypothetical protein
MPTVLEVSPEFKRRFCIAAAERGVGPNELLIEAS